METVHISAVGMGFDETSCGAFCQHPACWQSNQRKEKGFPLHVKETKSNREVVIETSLPEMSICNLIEGYGEDTRDRFPAKHSGRPSELQRQELVPPLNLKSTSAGSVVPSTTLRTPESVVKPRRKKSTPKVKVLEVQELFDVEDLESRWDETFITKQCYSWVPNPNRKPQSEEDTELKAITDGRGRSEGGAIPAKDITEQLVPEIIEIEREETRMPFYTLPAIKYKKRLTTRCRSPIYNRGRQSVKSSAYSRRVPFDSDGINNLLSLPSDVLMQVLDHLQDSDFLSKDIINDVIQDFQSPLIRDLTGISIGTTEALQQKKMSLLKDKKRNIRESHLMETRPVFQLDDGFVLDQISSVNTPVIDLESNDADTQELSIRGFCQHKKPLPAIGRLKAYNKKFMNKSKIASISLGLPELPSGIKHTRPFTYRKSDIFDLSIGPMPTPPTSVRSSSSAGSEHGTTLNVNYDSPTNNGSSRKQEIDVRFPDMPDSPEILPKAPVSTPATNKDQLFHRDKTGDSLKNQISRDYGVCPNPVNSPTNSEIGHRMVHETSLRDLPSTDIPKSIDFRETEEMQKAPDPNREHDGKTDAVDVDSTYSSPDPWPQVTESVHVSPVMTKDVINRNIADSEMPKSRESQSRSELQGEESEQEQMSRKMMEEIIKGTFPAPPPPSPESKEYIVSSAKPVSRESAFMEPVLEEETEDLVGGEKKKDHLDTEAQITTVSEVFPNPQSLVKERSLHNFINVDIPAESTSEQTMSASNDHSQLERIVQSFVSVDIPASTNMDDQELTAAEEQAKSEISENETETKDNNIDENELASPKVETQM